MGPGGAIMQVGWRIASVSEDYSSSDGSVLSQFQVSVFMDRYSQCQ